MTPARTSPVPGQPLAILATFVCVCLYSATSASGNFETFPIERITKAILPNDQSTSGPSLPLSLGVADLVSRSTGDRQTNSTLESTSPTSTTARVEARSKRKRRRSAQTIPVHSASRDLADDRRKRAEQRQKQEEEEEGEEERVPYGPIWTGSRENLECPGCDYNEIMRRNRIESIKEDLLRKLKMVAPPNITAPRYFSNFKNLLQPRAWFTDVPEDPDVQSDAPYDEYNGNDDDDDGDKSTAMRVFNFCQGLQSNRSNHNGREFACSFTFQSHIIGMEAVNASIGIHVERLGNFSHRRHQQHHNNQQSGEGHRVQRHPYAPTIFLYKVLENGDGEIFGKRRVYFAPNAPGTWVEIDAKHVVQSWLGDPSSNLGIVVRLETHLRDQGDYRVISPHSVERDTDVDNKPYVDVTLKAVPKSRRARRSATSDICEEVPEETECCRYPLIINFTEYNWDFVVHPKTYNAFYCSGFCTTALRLTHVHSHIAQQAMPDNGLCCSPKLYAPLHLLYTDTKSRLLSESLPSMITERCGCS